MIPPLPSTTLDANPQFAKLWKHVTTEVLDSDGSRRSLNEARRVQWLQRRSRGAVNHAERANETISDDSFLSEVDRDDSVRGPEQGSEHVDEQRRKDQKGQNKLNSLEHELNNLRVRRARRKILRIMIAQIAYHDDEENRDAFDTLASDNRRSHSRSHSRIPLPSKTKTRDEEDLPEIGEDRGAGQNGMADESDKLDHHATVTMTSAASTSRRVLSPQVRDVLLLVSAYLDTQADHRVEGANTSNQVQQDEDDDLFVEDMETFKANLSTISASTSAHLLATERRLMSLALAHLIPDTRPSPSPTIHHPPAPPNLYSTLRTQTQYLKHLHTPTLTTSIHTLTQTLTTLQSQQTTHLQTQLQTLQQTKHGILSRHALSRAAFFAHVATAMDLKLQVLVLEERIRARKQRDDEVDAVQQRARLREKLAALEREEKDVLEPRLRELRAARLEYDLVDPGARIMCALGTRYSEVEAEGERVRVDIERLERASR